MDFYRQPVEQVLHHFHTSGNGLSQEQINRQQTEYGRNVLETETEINRLKLFIDQFRSMIIYIMLFACLLSFFLNEIADATVIFIILFSNALIGYFQELSAHRSLEALKSMNTIRAVVVREGKKTTVDASELVPGDIIMLEPGSKVPADARIISCTQLKVEESALTGESLPVEKNQNPISEDVQISDQHNMLFSSTQVLEGTAKAVIVKIGMTTEIGRITEMIRSSGEQMTPLQIRLDDFGRKLGYAVIVICLIVMGVMTAKEYMNQGWSNEVILDLFLVSVALAVAAVPSGLPAVVTISLSIGVKKLLKKKALVRKLSSVETLGSCNVICSDKTGTLTQNEMTVKKAWSFYGEAILEGSGYSPEGKITGTAPNELWQIGAICNNSSVENKAGLWKVTGDPTEAALLVSGRKAHVNESAFIYLEELPFDSNRKRMSWKLKNASGTRLFTKGAPDQILEVCTHYLDQGREVKSLSPEERKHISAQVERYSEEALRVLAFAYQEIEESEAPKEENLIFVGLQAMIDPPRPEVKEAIRKCKSAGIDVVMITGDYQATAQAIGKDIGIEGKGLSGQQLSAMTDEELHAHLNDHTRVFSRVIPEHKQRIVTLLQHQQKVVAMTGDGVNDAPALKKANIGIAVGSGTDVAKEASDFVLMDDSFANIVDAIEEGRGIYENIQKAIMHLLSGNLSEVLIIFVATLLGWDLPLTAIMLLWINLVSDGAPALALAVDPYGKDVMQRKPKPLKEKILPKKEAWITVIMGLFSTVITLALFYLSGGTSEDTLLNGRTVAFSFLVLSELILMLNIRTYFGVNIFTNAWVWGSIAVGVGLQFVLVYSPLNEVFGLSVLSLHELGMIAAGGVLLYVLCWITAVVARNRN